MCRTMEKGCRGGGNESDGARILKGLTTSTCRARLKAGVSASSCRWSLDSPAQREAAPHAVRGRRSGGRGCPSRVDAAPAARAQQRARRSRGRGRELMPCSEEPPPREKSRTRAGFLFFDVAAERKDGMPRQALFSRREGKVFHWLPAPRERATMGWEPTTRGSGRSLIFYFSRTRLARMQQPDRQFSVVFQSSTLSFGRRCGSFGHPRLGRERSVRRCNERMFAFEQHAVEGYLGLSREAVPQRN